MAKVTALRLLVAAFLLLVIICWLRLLYVLPAFQHRFPSKKRTRRSHLLVVLGSGGHTAEMISLIRKLDPDRYAFRTYIVQDNDRFSSEKAVEFEKSLANKLLLERDKRLNLKGSYRLVAVPRARQIFQPLYTTPISSLKCLLACLKTLSTLPDLDTDSAEFNSTPDMILTNGPATGVIVVIAVLILRFFGAGGRGEMKSIYVESWARVKTLSLSGKILLKLGLTDRFLVQWESLKGGRAEWRGFLVE